MFFGLGRGWFLVFFKFFSNFLVVVFVLCGLWLEKVFKIGGLIGFSSCVGLSGGLCGDDRVCDMSGLVGCFRFF